MTDSDDPVWDDLESESSTWNAVVVASSLLVFLIAILKVILDNCQARNTQEGDNVISSVNSNNPQSVITIRTCIAVVNPCGEHAVGVQDLPEFRSEHQNCIRFEDEQKTFPPGAIGITESETMEINGSTMHISDL
mmetsp:Transcript_12840/g.24394  ORF Transcript_12840/g.24394 Transcript_12840/m.24394 type:complete len:135 (+) Transcript_12840:321-725(+)